MTASPRSVLPARVALAGLAAVAAQLLALSQPVRALDRDVVVRFLPPTNAPVEGYTIYLTDVATALEELIEIGFVVADPDGVARTTLVLDAARSYRVAMTAYNGAGESSRSNEIHVAAEAPPCDPALCQDGDPCTADSCDASGCLNSPLPDGAACDDGYEDTLQDQCVEGICAGVPRACQDDLDCDDGDRCNGLEVCDAGTVCLQGVAPDCGEPSTCAVSGCDAVGGCFTDSRPDGTPCDDGLASTRDDSCHGGVCAGIPSVGLEALDPAVVSPGRRTLIVHGWGFQPGTTLSFLNGKGKPPLLVSLRLVDDRTLEAIVDISRKGPKRARFWDARVALADGTDAWLVGALQIDP